MIYSVIRRWLGVELVEVSPLEKAVSALGGTLSIFVLVAVTGWAGAAAGSIWVVASMGASAVLLFGVPHGQLSQPWPVIVGHGVSAFIGVACARAIPDPTIAVACAVGLAILAMHQFKCIHPPGGATAFTAVLGGESIRHLGFKFVLFPVLANAVTMVLLAVLINSLFKWRRYPAVHFKPASRPAPAPKLAGGLAAPTHEEVLVAIKSLDSFVDITEEDLLRLTELLSHRPGVSPAKVKSIPDEPSSTA
ncbi:MAG TPA: HPP family protein [Candidatus Limnocylindria bacterium]|nr:HPP family protein [Candidatus Limnocylindria bacterium]